MLLSFKSTSSSLSYGCLLSPSLRLSRTIYLLPTISVLYTILVFHYVSLSLSLALARLPLNETSQKRTKSARLIARLTDSFRSLPRLRTIQTNPPLTNSIHYHIISRKRVLLLPNIAPSVSSLALFFQSVIYLLLNKKSKKKIYKGFVSKVVSLEFFWNCKLMDLCRHCFKNLFVLLYG